MKKILSIFMSVVMLLSITAGVDLSVQASGWLDTVKPIEFNTVYTESCSYYEPILQDGGTKAYMEAFSFNVPYNGTVTINISSKNKKYLNKVYYQIYHYDSLESVLPSGWCYMFNKEEIRYSSANDTYYGKFNESLTAGRYYFVVEYYDINKTYDGNYTIEFNYKSDMPRPSNIKVSSSSASGFNIKWSKVANVDGYLIKYATKSDFSNAAMVKVANGKATSKTINGRAANTKYYVKVQAYKKVNGTTYKSKWSETKAVRTLEKKNRITSITGKNGGFTVKWEKMNGKLGYQIRYATRSDFSNAATIYAGGGNATSKTVTGRARKTKYYVQVRSYVKQSNGKYKFDSWSPAKTVTTK